VGAPALDRDAFVDPAPSSPHSREDSSADSPNGLNRSDGSMSGEAGAMGTPSGTEAGAPACAACSFYGQPSARGAIPSVLGELSGLAASARHAGILYAHNDSGDIARLFAITDTGALVAELGLDGASAVDWEDMSLGPCPSGACLYVGDIGDNDYRRTSYAIYRVVEPQGYPASGSQMLVSYERFAFVYPDGPHNAEALLVHPQSGRIFVIVKAASPDVYELPTPLMPNEVATLAKVATLTLPALAGVVTGGSFHPCGGRLLIRTYAAVHEFVQPGGEPFEAIFGAPATLVPVALEPQGEAVTYAADGQGYFTASETVIGAPAPELNGIGCQ
jgi:hypothetical protein